MATPTAWRYDEVNLEILSSFADGSTMTHRSVALALFLATGSACSSESDGPSGESPCDGSATTTMSYVAGLPATGVQGKLRFTLEDANPAPPGRGTNRWQVQVRESAGQPAVGATVTKVRPWMPDHGHGATTKPTVTVDSNGLATVDALELVMPGVWTVTISAEHEGTSDEATFAFCIDG